jgi:UDP-N-acetylmuramate: L-alanyl-gamma-D-glutamyl-meso-diaminopimelate ligase
VGAQLEGFDRMVRLSNAPLIVIEGDEYLSSPIDRVPKIHHYRPHVTVLTGIAWDHINVFPTYEQYKEQFAIYLKTIVNGGTVIYCAEDSEVVDIVQQCESPIQKIRYTSFERGEGDSIVVSGNSYPISVIGRHNLQNMEAAYHVCRTIGVEEGDFLQAIEDFSGAAKRLQLLSKNDRRRIYLDFAHAPSKVKATTRAIKEWYGVQPLLTVLELHTFSSLNKEFIPQYRETLNNADTAVVFYNKHTLEMKRMPPLDDVFIREAFDHDNIHVITDEQELSFFLKQDRFVDNNILLMTSGNFTGMDMSKIY